MLASVQRLLWGHYGWVGSRMKGKESRTSLTLMTGQQQRHTGVQLSHGALTPPEPQPRESTASACH